MFAFNLILNNNEQTHTLNHWHGDKINSSIVQYLYTTEHSVKVLLRMNFPALKELEYPKCFSVCV